MYKSLTTSISPEEIRISEIKWKEPKERTKYFIWKEKNFPNFITESLPEKNFSSEPVFFSLSISIRQFIFQN